MTKVFAPALSLDASGTIGDAITFSKWKGRHYIRQRVIPANPKSGLQVGFRSMFRFLAQNWAALTAPNKATWNDLADAAVISNFNAYMGNNQDRWRRFNSPTVQTPATETDAVGTYTAGTPAATGGVASVVIAHTIDLLINENWGLMIFKGTTGFNTALSNCVAVILSDTVDVAYSFLDSPLSAATYYYNCRLFTLDGVLGPELGEISAAAT